MSVFCISQNKLIASADFDDNSTNIHLWDFTQLEPLLILKNAHRNKVSLLEFFGGDQFLVSVSVEREVSYACIFSIAQNQKLVSIQFKHLVHDIIPIYNS